MRTKVCVGLRRVLYNMGMKVMGSFQLACKALGYTKRGLGFKAFVIVVTELLWVEVTRVLW